jgi:hypothetical protein
MKETIFNQQTSSSTAQTDLSAGSQGSVLAPPAYGISGLDQVSAAMQSSYTLTPPGPSTVWDAVERSLETDADNQQPYTLPERQVTIGGEQHTLFYEDHAGKLEIMLASNPKLLTSLLTGVLPNPSGSLMEQLQYHVTIFDAAASGWKNEFGRALKLHLTELQAFLDALPGGSLPDEVGPRPQTRVTWGSVGSFDGDKRGTSMQANPLTLKPPAGAAIYGQQPATDYTPYIAGHLLNHHLYGPASDENLVPMSSDMNTAFSANIEEKVKQAVFMENRVLFYQVMVVPSPGRPFIPEKIQVTVRELNTRGTAPLTDGWKANYEVDQLGTVSIPLEQNPPDPAPIRRDNAALMETAFQRLEDEQGSLDPSIPEQQQLLTQIANAQAAQANQIWQLSSMAFKARRAWNLEHAEYLAELLTTIVSLLPALPATTSITAPATVVNYGPTLRFHLFGDVSQQLECGTSMDANPLSINPGTNRGTEPEQESPYGLRWVQGHLLNHHLHGRGKPYNLVPMTSSANTTMEGEAENAAKEAVFERGETVQYTATVEEYSNAHELPLTMTRADHDHNKGLGLPNYPSDTYEALFNPADPEAYLPKKIKWTLSLPSGASNTWTYDVHRASMKRSDEEDFEVEESEEESEEEVKSVAKRRRK